MVRFRMFKINVEQFAMLVEKMQQDKHEVMVETRFQFKVAHDHKVAPVARFMFTNKEQPTLMLELSCEFDIYPEDWKKMVKNDEVTVSKETLCYLAAQTVGVARGVLYCKTEGTPFNKLILPSINVASMIKEDLTMSLPKQ